MIRILASCLLILSTIIYCVVEKNNTNKVLDENCIEIYLYKEFITPENNIELKKSEYYKENKNGELKDLDENYLNRLAFDTIEKKIVTKYGEFKNKIKSIESTPFIKNNEISFFQNSKDSTTILVLNKKIKSEVKYTNGWDDHLKQFVVLVNNKPALNGYLFYSMSSSICDNTNILIYGGNELLLLDFSNRKITNTNLKKDYPELYHAFKNSNRLIE